MKDNINLTDEQIEIQNKTRKDVVLKLAKKQKVTEKEIRILDGSYWQLKEIEKDKWIQKTIIPIIEKWMKEHQEHAFRKDFPIFTYETKQEVNIPSDDGIGYLSYGHVPLFVYERPQIDDYPEMHFKTKSLRLLKRKINDDFVGLTYGNLNIL